MADTAKDIAEITLSKQAHARREDRQRRLTLLRVGLIGCFFMALLLLLACLQIGRIPVREIAMEGNAHYSTEQLQSALDIQIGDAIYGFDTSRVAKELLADFPYLKTAEISTSLTGTVTVRVEERNAIWALLCETEDQAEQQYLLLDEGLYALEYTRDAMTACIVTCPGLALPEVGQTLLLAAKQAQAEYDAWLKEQKEEPTQPSPAYLVRAERLADKLTSLTSYYEDMTLPEAPVSLDLTNEYDSVLTLRDDTVYLLGNAKNIPELLARAKLALSQYRAEQGQAEQKTPLMVDLRDPLRVLITKNYDKE